MSQGSRRRGLAGWDLVACVSPGRENGVEFGRSRPFLTAFATSAVTSSEAESVRSAMRAIWHAAFAGRSWAEPAEACRLQDHL